jgi:LysR family transcriptional regulator, benzoate and cis,cis-muconate-responsive activator of ben and cat genes
MDANVSLEAQIFVLALAREGSFSRAAKKLHITQPALTRKVGVLEKQLGIKLFSRAYHHLELTPAGRLFLPEAQASVQHAERAFELARRQARVESGPLRLGYSPYVHSDLVPMLQRWQLQDISTSRGLILESGSTADIAERVMSGRLHAGLGILPVVDEQLWVNRVAREQFCVCMPKNHPLAQKASVSAKDLHGEKLFWIPRTVHPAFYDQTIEYVRGLGVQPVFHEVGAATQAMEIVSHGFGLTLLPRSFARFSRTGIVFKLLSDLFLRIETGLFVRQSQRHDPLQHDMQLMLSQLRALQLNVQ